MHDKCLYNIYVVSPINSPPEILLVCPQHRCCIQVPLLLLVNSLPYILLSFINVYFLYIIAILSRGNCKYSDIVTMDDDDLLVM